MVDDNGTIVSVRETLEAACGQQAIGKKCCELYRDACIQCSDCPLYRGINVGETNVYETTGVLGGRTLQISHTGMIFQGKKAMLEIFQDVTERKLMV